MMEDQVEVSTTKLKDNAWTQQRLKTWTPYLTLTSGIELLSMIGIICLILGILILNVSKNLEIHTITYDYSSSSIYNDTRISFPERCRLSSSNDANSFSNLHTCYITIIINNDFKGILHIFYELKNFYQNHRRFVTSINLLQLVNRWRPGDSTSSCEPLKYIDSSIKCHITNCDENQSIKRQLYPCGIASNTMFNDIFWLHEGFDENNTLFLGPKDMSSNNIARNYSLNNQFKNPTFNLNDINNGDVLPIWENPNMSRIIPPPLNYLNNTQDDIKLKVNFTQINNDYNNSTAWVTEEDIDLIGRGLENQHWRVWMDFAAGTNSFLKLYGKIGTKDRIFKKGTKLIFAVQSNFYVRSFNGEKSIVIGDVNPFFGSKNIELGLLAIIIGIIYLIAGLFFLQKRIRNPRSLGVIEGMTWKKIKKNL